MVFGWRGRKPIGARITAGVALATLLVGQLRMAYALPATAGSPPQTPAEIAGVASFREAADGRALGARDGGQAGADQGVRWWGGRVGCVATL